MYIAFYLSAIQDIVRQLRHVELFHVDAVADIEDSKDIDNDLSNISPNPVTTLKRKDGYNEVHSYIWSHFEPITAFSNYSDNFQPSPHHFRQFLTIFGHFQQPPTTPNPKLPQTTSNSRQGYSVLARAE